MKARLATVTLIVLSVAAVWLLWQPYEVPW